jgi:hypothetical protein
VFRKWILNQENNFCSVAVCPFLQVAWDAVAAVMDHVLEITVSIHLKHLAVNQSEVATNSAITVF